VTVPAVIGLLRIISSLLATAATNPVQSVTDVAAERLLELVVEMAKIIVKTKIPDKINFFICKPFL